MKVGTLGLKYAPGQSGRRRRLLSLPGTSRGRRSQRCSSTGGVNASQVHKFRKSTPCHLTHRASLQRGPSFTSTLGLWPLALNPKGGAASDFRPPSIECLSDTLLEAKHHCARGGVTKKNGTHRQMLRLCHQGTIQPAPDSYLKISF